MCLAMKKTTTMTTMLLGVSPAPEIPVVLVWGVEVSTVPVWVVVVAVAPVV